MTDLLAGQATPAVPVNDLMSLTHGLPCVASGGGAQDDVWLTDEDREWLEGKDPEQSRIAALLHTEVLHDGACYVRRAGWAMLTSVGFTTVGELGYASGRYFGHGPGHGHLSLLPTVIGTPVALSTAVLFVLAAVAYHALWHRDEAPWIHILIEDDDCPVARDGC